MELLLISHIALFSLSLILTSSSTAVSAAGKRVPTAVMKSNVAVSSLGVASGLVLLIGKPLGAYCAMLLGYVVVFGLTYYVISRRNQRLAFIA